MQEVFATVQHTSKAGKDEDFLFFLYHQLIDDLVEYDEFSRGMDHMFTKIIRVRLCVRKNIGVVTALYQED